jgi:hypothetical protein
MIVVGDKCHQLLDCNGGFQQTLSNIRCDINDFGRALTQFLHRSIPHHSPLQKDRFRFSHFLPLNLLNEILIV